MLRQTLKQSLGHVFKVAADVEIVDSNAVFAFQIKVVEDKVLWL